MSVDEKVEEDGALEERRIEEPPEEGDPTVYSEGMKVLMAMYDRLKAGKVPHS